MTFPRGSTQPCLAIKAGDLIGNYRIEENLADGGMGSVHRASHVILPRRAAIKILHADMLTVRSAIERMLQEARILDSIQHPSFVRVYAAMLDKQPANRPSLRVVQRAMLLEAARPLDDDDLAPTISIEHADDDLHYYDVVELGAA